MTKKSIINTGNNYKFRAYSGFYCGGRCLTAATLLKTAMQWGCVAPRAATAAAMDYMDMDLLKTKV